MSTIPNSIPYAITNPVRRQRSPNVTATLVTVATFPALAALGVGVRALERLRDRLQRGWLSGEG